MEQKSKTSFSLKDFLIRMLQGALIGLGAVLPGISGGVLCVIFGIYKPIMELLSHPFKTLKKNMMLLLPVIIGGGLGFLGIAKILDFLLETYPDASVCVFVGLIAGMFPSLFREARQKGVSGKDYVSLAIAFALIFALLLSLQFVSFTIEPNIGWHIFCGFCLALSVIAPGMSFSTLLMPLGLYAPFIDAIGDFEFSVLIPAGCGALLTVLLFAKAVDYLLAKHYSVVSHAIIGVVIAATILIVPYASFASGVIPCIVNIVCLVGGVAAALLLDRLNSSVEKPEL